MPGWFDQNGQPQSPDDYTYQMPDGSTRNYIPFMNPYEQGGGIQPAPTQTPAPRTNMPSGTPVQMQTPGLQPSAGGQQDPRAFFDSLFPGTSLTPQQLAAKEAELQAQGIRLLGPNAQGMRTKIQLPNGQIVDAIQGAAAGHNIKQWGVEGPSQNTQGAAGAVAGSLGAALNGGGVNYNARMGALQDTPGYKFRFDEGMKALQNSAAAKGTLLTGGAMKDAIGFGQGMASTEFDNEYNRLFGMAGLGQSAQGAIGQYGSSYANNSTGLITGAGNAQAAGTIGSGNAYNDALGGIGGNVLDAWAYRQFMKPPQQQLPQQQPLPQNPYNPYGPGL